MLLVGVNALVGSMLGQERTVVPLIAVQVFHLRAYSVVLTYIVAFGVVKAATNFVAGALSERLGRKPVLVAGWLVALPIPLLVGWGPSWGWIIVANVLLGVSQGLTWSTTVIMKIDLVGPGRRGLAMGLNEAAGYVAVSVMALATGALAAHNGLRPDPFFLGLAVAGLGVGVSTLFVRETLEHARDEARSHQGPAHLHGELSLARVLRITSLSERSLSAVSQAGLVNNLNDGVAWGVFPLLFTQAGLGVGDVGVLSAIYPAVWGLGQLGTGALSDHWGRKPLIVSGMLVQAGALLVVARAHSFGIWALAMVGLGAGTALVYPTLLAAVGDVAHPSWRASAIGVYRLWRDAGFAVGALLAGYVADRSSLADAVTLTGLLTAASGVLVAWRMRETLARARRT